MHNHVMNSSIVNNVVANHADKAQGHQDAEKIMISMTLTGWWCSMDWFGYFRFLYAVVSWAYTEWCGTKKPHQNQQQNFFKYMCKNISAQRDEQTNQWTVSWFGYNHRRPHWVQLLLSKNRNQRLQMAQAHWAAEGPGDILPLFTCSCPMVLWSWSWSG